MSDLIAIAYPDEAAATPARARLADAVKQGLVDVADVVVIAYDDDGRLLPIIAAAIADSDMSATLAAHGMQPLQMTRGQFTHFVDNEARRAARIVGAQRPG